MMFKKLLFTCAMLLPVAAMAQAGSATTEPDASAQEAVADSSTEAAAQSTAPQAQAGQTAPGAVVAATAADVKVGVVVKDQTGGDVGTIESVTGEGAVISTGKSRAQVTLAAFAKKDGALVIGMTKAELDAAVAAQKPSS